MCCTRHLRKLQSVKRGFVQQSFLSSEWQKNGESKHLLQGGTMKIQQGDLHSLTQTAIIPKVQYYHFITGQLQCLQIFNAFYRWQGCTVKCHELVFAVCLSEANRVLFNINRLKTSERQNFFVLTIISLWLSYCTLVKIETTILTFKQLLNLFLLYITH